MDVALMMLNKEIIEKIDNNDKILLDSINAINVRNCSKAESINLKIEHEAEKFRRAVVVLGIVNIFVYVAIGLYIVLK